MGYWSSRRYFPGRGARGYIDAEPPVGKRDFRGHEGKALIESPLRSHSLETQVARRFTAPLSGGWRYLDHSPNLPKLPSFSQ